MPATHPPSSALDRGGPLLPMLSAVLAVVGVLALAALVPGGLTLLAALLAMVAVLGVLLAVMGRLLADEGEPDEARLQRQDGCADPSLCPRPHVDYSDRRLTARRRSACSPLTTSASSSSDRASLA